MYTKQIGFDFADLDQVEALAKEAFPPEEYLAPGELIAMAERGEADFLGLYDKDRFVGFMVVSLYEDMCYLFFLAIDPSLRSKGYGGQTLRLLEHLYPNRRQVVDFERVDVSAANYEQRVIRKAFYMRNGYQETGKLISYLGVEYEILCKGQAFDFEMFQRMMKRFRIKGFQPIYFEQPAGNY